MNRDGRDRPPVITRGKEPPGTSFFDKRDISGKENDMTKIPGRNSTGHGGNIHEVLREAGRNYGEIIDFSANINPLGAPEWLRPLVSRELDKLGHYPDPEYGDLARAIAAWHQVRPEQVLPANGSTDLLYLLPRILPCSRAVIPAPSYIDYERAARLAGLEVAIETLAEGDDFRLDVRQLATRLQKGDLVILASPNNPTGGTVPAREILALAGDFTDCMFLVDEAFLDFVEGGRASAARPKISSPSTP